MMLMCIHSARHDVGLDISVILCLVMADTVDRVGCTCVFGDYTHFVGVTHRMEHFYMSS